MTAREDVIARSGGQCEALIVEERVRYRCGKSPVEVHHLLTRARGGAILDEVGEIHHLGALCRDHHVLAHSPGGRENFLLIDGYVGKDSLTGLPVYTGPDPILTAKYPKASAA